MKAPDTLAVLAWCEERLRQPEPYLGPQGREDRERVLVAMATSPADGVAAFRLRPAACEEFRPGYLSKVRRRILGLPEPAAVDIRPRLDRAMGEKR